MNDSLLKTEDYLDLVQDVWPGSYSFSLTEQALTKTGIGTKLMELAWVEAPTSLFFGAQPGKESFYERLGYEKSMQSFGRKKPRRC